MDYDSEKTTFDPTLQGQTIQDNFLYALEVCANSYVGTHQMSAIVDMFSLLKKDSVNMYLLKNQFFGLLDYDQHCGVLHPAIVSEAKRAFLCSAFMAHFNREYSDIRRRDLHDISHWVLHKLHGTRDLETLIEHMRHALPKLKPELHDQLEDSLRTFWSLS